MEESLASLLGMGRLEGKTFTKLFMHEGKFTPSKFSCLRSKFDFGFYHLCYIFWGTKESYMKITIPISQTNKKINQPQIRKSRFCGKFLNLSSQQI